MSVQVLSLMMAGRYAAWLNAFALFLAFAGAWLLIATRIRYARAIARVSIEGQHVPVQVIDEPTRRVNRFFNLFGMGCLALSLAVSWFSTQL